MKMFKTLIAGLLCAMSLVAFVSCGNKETIFIFTEDNQVSKAEGAAYVKYLKGLDFGKKYDFEMRTRTETVDNEDETVSYVKRDPAELVANGEVVVVFTSSDVNGTTNVDTGALVPELKIPEIDPRTINSLGLNVKELEATPIIVRVTDKLPTDILEATKNYKPSQELIGKNIQSRVTTVADSYLNSPANPANGD